MIGGLATPTRDGNDHHRGVLTDASSRMNRQRTNSFSTKQQYQCLSPDSFTTPDCKGFNTDYYLETAGRSSQSPHRRLRRDTSTRTLRSLARYQQTRRDHNQYDTIPYTPSKLSKVMIAEYELDISDIDTPFATMVCRLDLLQFIASSSFKSPQRYRGLININLTTSSLPDCRSIRNCRLSRFSASKPRPSAVVYWMRPISAHLLCNFLSFNQNPLLKNPRLKTFLSRTLLLQNLILRIPLLLLHPHSPTIRTPIRFLKLAPLRLALLTAPRQIHSS